MVQLRRIQKEKKQQNIKMKYIAEADLAEFVEENTEGGYGDYSHSQPFVEQLRIRIDSVKEARSSLQGVCNGREEATQRRAVNVDSDLSDFLI